MSEREVKVLCHWNGRIKHGADGVYYEGSTTKMSSIKPTTNLRRFLDQIYLIAGLDKERSKYEVIGRYPVLVSPDRISYSLYPISTELSLEKMLEVPSKHPSIENLEFYFVSDVKRPPNAVHFPPARSSPSSKRQRTQQNVEYKSKTSVSYGSSGYPEGSEPDFVAHEVERVVRKQPTISVTELNKFWKDKFDYELETLEVENAKDEAIKKVFGDWDQSFRVLPKLMAALHSSNGMVVDWKYDVSPNPESASFSGLFWAFSQSIEGFLHCRPLVVVDHTEMYGEYQLNLMIASGVDAANNFFPLAFAVTKEVSVDSWRWFLNGVREKVTQRKGICLISSPHPDILAAVINEPESRWKEPWAYHRFCLTHLRSQFTDVFKDGDLAYLLGKAGSTIQKEEFDSNMKEIEKMNPKARKWLNQFTPNQWALAHDNGLRYGIMEINTEDLFAVCEGFQPEDQETTLTGSFLLLFDKLRESFEESFSSSRGSLSRGDVYTEPVTEKLEEFVKDSATYGVRSLEGDAYQVSRTPKKKERTLMGRKTDTSTICIVQLNESSCTCGKFQKKKFPCMHALAVCDKLNINPLQYVDDCYTAERYHKTYAATFSPVKEISAWPEAFGVPTLCPPPRLPNSSASPNSSVSPGSSQNFYEEY